ncbi:C-type lectin domain family 5 member A isoform X2 [Oryctolagus cuniculus]|uniref:C-type lectin domain family 5 member A n=1 Tax=Oryctolagus cuniculus TaxID=9986 RepID=A0A5F9CKB7_RABIT|nr:C-type lectin domain family 5 member A isoform X2 [Oryctolagus cuniculus]
MNWHMIISALVVVLIKVVGMTLFLLYFPEIFGSRNDSISPTRSYGRVCPKDWDLHQGRCFFLSTSELSWNKSRDDCQTRGSTLAIVNTPEKLEYLQDLAGAEKYLIGLMYQPAQKRWRWIDNSVFNGNVTNQHQNFNCVTIGLSKTFDAASCDVTYRWICEKNPV